MRNNQSSFYLDEKGNIKASLISERAKQEAKRMHGNLTTTQLRSFFDEVRDIETLVENDPEKLKKHFARFQLLKAKANYNKNRKSSKLPYEFVNFLCNAIDNVHSNNIEEFKAFCMYFEAFVGFAKIVS